MNRVLPVSFLCKRARLYQLQRDDSLSLEESDLRILSTDEPELVEVTPMTMRGAAALLQLSEKR